MQHQYCGYKQGDTDDLNVYVSTKDMKIFLDTVTVSHANYLRSAKWAQIKDYVRERDNYTCSKCSKNMVDNLYELHTHHLTYERLGNENLETDLILLCADCHSKEHSKIIKK